MIKKILPNYLSSRRFIAIFFVFSLSLGLRISYNKHTVIINPIRADAAKYVTYASNLARHGVYSQESGPTPTPDAQVTPGYPLFLALIFNLTKNPNKIYQRILLSQSILGALTALLAFELAIIFLPFWASVGVGILTSLSPHLITSGSYILTETLFTFLTVAALLILAIGIKTQKTLFLFFSSFLVGLAALVRPAILLFPIILIPFLIFVLKPRKRWLGGFFLILGITLAWIPWASWSQTQVRPAPTKDSLAWSSFFMGSYPNLTFRNPQLKGYPYREDPDYQKMVSNPYLGLKILKKRIFENPIKYFFWYTIGKPVMFWSWNNLVGSGEFYIYPVKTSLYKTSALAAVSSKIMKIIHYLFVFLSLAAFIGLVFFDRESIMNKTNIFLAFTIFLYMIYFTSIHTVLTPLPRYSIPLRPFLYLGSVFAIKYLWELLQTPRAILKKKLKLPIKF